MITLYTVAGTGHGGASGATNTGANGFPALVGTLVDKTLYTWAPVPYPAGFPFVSSVKTGVATLTGMINSTPGKFALIGYSQGAMVTSGVLDALQTGGLRSRMGDCIAAVTFGNPRRQAGHACPVCPDPGGHGIEADNLLKNTPSWWWDFAIPHDIAANIGDDTNSKWLSTVFDAFCQDFEPNADLALFLTTIRGLPWSLVLLFLHTLPYLISPNISASDPIGAPHGQYAMYVPPGQKATCLNLAVQYFNTAARGA
jgi:hypothetical protein